MKKLIALLLAVCLLTGCQLATTEKKETVMNDKLVGVFVTFEYLDLGIDLEGYLADNGFSDGEVIDPGMEYKNRLYAEVTEDGWEFPGYEGLIMGQMWQADHWAGFSTTGFCEHKTHVTRTDTLDGIEEEGTVYVPLGTEVHLNSNPVYMTPDGEYYTVQGNSFGSTIDEGSMSQSVSDERTWTEEDVEYTYSAKFTTTVQGVKLAQRIVLVQMSADHAELSRAEYVPGQLPESITPEPDAAYIIVEEYADGEVTRTLRQPGDDPIRVFCQEEQVYCLPQFTDILWEE